MEEAKRRYILRHALNKMFSEFDEEGADEEASAVYDALTALDFEERPDTYLDLYERYILSEQINHAPAALGAFYALFCPIESSPRTALKEGFQFDMSSCPDAKIELPAWIVVEFLTAIDRYLSGKCHNLNQAFNINNGDKGRNSVLSPVDDFDTAIAHAYFRMNRVIRNETPARDATRLDIEEYVRNRSPNMKANGFDARTTAKKIERIKNAYPADNFQSAMQAKDD